MSYVSRWLRIISVAVAAAALAGCGMLRLTYNQAPDLVFWWLDGYVDFNGAQSPRVRESIAEWFRWHRSTQLPDYAGLLAEARVQIAKPATPEQACHWWDEVQLRMDTAVDEALPPMARFVGTMTPQQLQHLEKRYAKGLQEARKDFLQQDREERLEASVKRVVDRAELLYGRLDAPQRQAIAEGVAASPFDPERWIAEREALNREALATLSRLLQQQAQVETVRAELKRLIEQARRSPRAEHRDYQRRLTQYNCAFAARVHNLTTPAQRQAADKRLADWEADLRSLAARNGDRAAQ